MNALCSAAPLIDVLVCPRDHARLVRTGNCLACLNGHEYPVVDGIPVMLLADQRQTIGIAEASRQAAVEVAEGKPPEDPFFINTLGVSEEERQGVLAAARAGGAVDPVAQFMIGATNGILYRELIGKLTGYTIPELRLPPGQGRRLLDIGCNWGRWSVAAARLGYRPVGIDPSLGAVLAARRVSRQLGLEADFVVGDARFLPFSKQSFDNVFSYSVIQHFSKPDARTTFAEIGRVLVPGGDALLQMPNVWGVRCLYHQARRGFREPLDFEVRYWTTGALTETLGSLVGPTTLSVDCFFGIGLQAADAHLMPADRRCMIRLSEWLRRLSSWAMPLVWVADSIYVHASKPTM
jgi:SAM-dependent methyltransferase/uncharacterized protein YbaR (Trm112 family)